MTRKKNKFFTFCFSLIPGAGEMYLGFMKQGVSLMTFFFLLIAVAGYINLPFLLFLEPVVWFYGFFHVHNLRGMPDEEFYAVEDDYLFHADLLLQNSPAMIRRHRHLTAAALIILGICILWNNLTGLFYQLFSMIADYYVDFSFNFWYHLARSVPQMLIAAVIILWGVRMIRTKKEEGHPDEPKRLTDKTSDPEE